MHTGIISINRQKIFFEMHGEGTDLVMLMGIGQNSSPWHAYQVPAFSNDFHIILLDNRDAGRSSRAASAYSIADMAGDVAGVLDALEIERAHILGHSMGGMIAMDFALHHPARLDKLVLACTAAGTARARFDPFTVWSFVMEQDPDGEMFAAMQFAWSNSVEFLRDHKTVEEALTAGKQNPYPMDLEAFKRQAHAYLTHDALGRLHQISADTLVVAAERDRLTPPYLGREIADAIPDATFHLIEGPRASHAVFVEQPDDYNQPILSFLKG